MVDHLLASSGWPHLMRNDHLVGPGSVPLDEPCRKVGSGGNAEVVGYANCGQYPLGTV